MTATAESLPRLPMATLPGVWPPHRDAWLLARAVTERGFAAGADCLDLFTGSGALAVSLARAAPRSVTAVDISRRALFTTRLNAWRHGVRVTTLHGDLLAPVGDRSFDLIVANPPYIPGRNDLPGRGLARAWEGGLDGRVLIDRLSREAPAHLRPGGRLLMVHSSMNGEQRSVELLAQQGLSAEVLERHRGRIGAVSASRVARLRELGLLEPGDDDYEDTVIISAVRNDRA